jgi:pimeloyl-ACP methyl ester carboxylesterase
MEELRVLCLHGYHGDAQVLRRQMAPLADSLDGLVALVYLDAPSLAAGDFGWWHAEAAERGAGVRPGAKHYRGWQRTHEAIVSAFALQGPFDGVFGFSQGAALTSLLVGLRSCGDPAGNAPGRPESGISSQTKSLAFDFAVMAGGFVVADTDLASLYEEKSHYDLPSAHIIGRSDAVVPKEASLALASRFNNPLILAHEGGHVISNAPEVREGLRTFLEEMRQRKKTPG